MKSQFIYRQFKRQLCGFQLIINFPNQFSDLDPKTDKNLLQKLLTPEEMSGILNWALEGLARLMKNGRFTGAESAKAIEARYERNADPITAFLEERTEKDDKSYTSKEDLWRAFFEFCEEYEIPNTFTKNTFGKRIKDMYPSVKHDNVRCWQYIKIINKEEYEKADSTNSLILSSHSDQSVEEIQRKLVKTGETHRDGDSNG